jgi:hypothetical protein
MEGYRGGVQHIYACMYIYVCLFFMKHIYVGILTLLVCSFVQGQLGNYAILCKVGGEVCTFVQFWEIMTLCTTQTPTVWVVRSDLVCNFEQPDIFYRRFAGR